MTLLALLLIPLAWADTLEVCSSGCDHDTIQDALDVASPGDRVLVHPGTWVEDLGVVEAVELISRDGPTQTTLKSTGIAATAVLAIPAAATGTTVSGFTIVPGPEGRGVEVMAEAHLEDLDIIGPSDHYMSSDGGGLWVSTPELVTLYGVRISGLDATDGGGAFLDAVVEAELLEVDSCAASQGGGVYVSYAGSLSCTACTFSNNTAYATLGGIGGGIATWGPLTLQSSTLTDNSADTGAHLASWYASSLVITDSELSGGRATQSAGGLDAWAVTSIDLSGNTWSDNQALGSGVTDGTGGHALLLSSDTTTIRGDTFEQGSAATAGGALWVESGDLSVTESRFVSNTSTHGGAIYYHGLLDARSSLSIDHSELLSNSAEQGGALYVESNLTIGLEPDDVLISDTVIHGNSADWGGGLMVLGPRYFELVRSSVCDNIARSRGGGDLPPRRQPPPAAPRPLQRRLLGQCVRRLRGRHLRL